MKYRFVPFFVAILALSFWMGGPALADKDNPHEGKVVRAADGKLTMTDKDGKNEHTHTITATTKITCDGKECKLEDLKPNYEVKVTTEKQGDRTVVTKIEGKKK